MDISNHSTTCALVSYLGSRKAVSKGTKEATTSITTDMTMFHRIGHLCVAVNTASLNVPARAASALRRSSDEGPRLLRLRRFGIEDPSIVG